MNPRALIVLALSLGASPFLSPIALSLAIPAPGIEMGYGPSYLTPVGGGTPVYTEGDQLWMRSDYNQTILVDIGPSQPPMGANTTGLTLEPGLPTLVHTFTPSDVQGLWQVSSNSQSFMPFSFLVTDIAGENANLSMTAYGIAKSSLAMNFSSDQSLPFYDATACLLGTGDHSSAQVDVPQSFGGGQLGIDRRTDGISVTGVGLGNTSYTVDFELYHTYAFSSSSSPFAFTSRQVLVGSTPGLALSRGNSFGLISLFSDIPLRTGRYDLRAVFQGASGVAVSQTQVLLTGGPGWVWLGECESTGVHQNAFSLTSHLGVDPMSWPRELYLLYRVYGVEGFAHIPLGIVLSAVEFVGEPWSVPLTSYDLRAQSSSDVSTVIAGNATIFLVDPAPAAFVRYSLGLGGKGIFNGSAGPISPFSYTQVGLNVSRLSVKFANYGTVVEGADVLISQGASNLSRAATGRDGTATIYLPSGAYNVTATDGNNTFSTGVVLAQGQSYSITLGLTRGADQSMLWILGLSGSAAIGIALNGYVFLRNRRRRAKFRS